MKFCNQCGNQLEKSLKFCPKCGNKVGTILDNQQMQPTPLVETEPKPEVPPKPTINYSLAFIALLYCPILGIYAYYLASRVHEYYHRGMYKAAQKTANEIKTWSIIGIVFFTICLIIYLVMAGQGNKYDSKY